MFCPSPLKGGLLSTFEDEINNDILVLLVCKFQRSVILKLFHKQPHNKPISKQKQALK